MNRRCFVSLLLGVGVLAGYMALAFPADPPEDAFSVNAALGRGVNLGNMLEAPNEGDWGVRLEDGYFPLIREAGFDSVRIPIRWSAHAAEAAPYTINDSFLQRIDHVIDQALEHDLRVVLNIHHYEEIHEHPEANQDRLNALWRQIGHRYRELPRTVCFEMLNEPHAELTAGLWNRMLAETLEVIRESNPDRIVVIGPVSWNNYAHLDELTLPEDDRNLIVTFHYYDPFRFTHQGAPWIASNVPPVGRVWEGTAAERLEIEEAFDTVSAWSREKQRPILLGEFGAFRRADMESRVRWTRCVRDQAEERSFSWAYWELASGFGVYDPEGQAWRVELLQALVGE